MLENAEAFLEDVGKLSLGTLFVASECYEKAHLQVGFPRPAGLARPTRPNGGNARRVLLSEGVPGVAHAEVGAVRVLEHQRAHARFGIHHHALSELDVVLMVTVLPHGIVLIG